MSYYRQNAGHDDDDYRLNEIESDDPTMASYQPNKPRNYGRGGGVGGQHKPTQKSEAQQDILFLEGYSPVVVDGAELVGGGEKVTTVNSSYTTTSTSITLDPEAAAQEDEAAREAATRSMLDRTKLEQVENLKFSKYTIRQACIKGLSITGREFFASLIYYTCALMAKSTGMGFASRALMNFGLLTGLISIFSRLNAGHMDPLVSVMLCALGKIGLPWYFLGVYVLAQTLAATVAPLFVWSLTPGFDRSLGLGTEVLSFGFTPGQGLGALIGGCFVTYAGWIWMVLCSGGGNNLQTTGKNPSYNLQFGLVVAGTKVAAGIAFGQVAGENFNWMLYFFPAIISGTIDTSNWWIWFLCGPLAMFLVLGTYYFDKWLTLMADGDPKERKGRLND